MDIRERHAREMMVQRVGLAIREAVCKVIGEYPDITHAELTNVLGETLLAWNRYAIRDEREEGQVG